MSYINLLDIIYPTGTFYISANNISPATIVGGFWISVDNAVLRGTSEGSIGYTGSDEHTLTIEEMPSHSHHSYQYQSNGDAIRWCHDNVNLISNISYVSNRGGATSFNYTAFIQLLYLVQSCLSLKDVI